VNCNIQVLDKAVWLLSKNSKYATADNGIEYWHMNMSMTYRSIVTISLQFCALFQRTATKGRGLK